MDENEDIARVTTTENGAWRWERRTHTGEFVRDSGRTFIYRDDAARDCSAENRNDCIIKLDPA